MKNLILTLIAAFSLPSFSAELKDVFPLACAMYYMDDNGKTHGPLLSQTFDSVDEIDTVNTAAFWWKLYSDHDADEKYSFGYIDGKFKAVYTRPETEEEVNKRLTKTNDSFDQTMVITELETAYASIDDLAAGKDFRFSSEETPEVTLVCQKYVYREDKKTFGKRTQERLNRISPEKAPTHHRP